MIVGALVDLGVPLEEIAGQVRSMGLGNVSVSARRAQSGPMTGTKVEVRWDQEQTHRALADVAGMLARSELPHRSKELALQVFRTLAAAEAKVHGVDVESVHFHEVGAVDAIVDVVGTVFGLEYLGIERVYCTPLPLGRGFAQSSHGLLPLPAPATLEILASVKAPVRWVNIEAELVTPTGAALLATVASFETPSMRVEKVGYGLGTYELPWPNVLRAVLGEVSDSGLREELVLLETNVDDMTGEELGFAMEQLMALGALDVFFTPIQMKKNRPAVKLSVLAERARGSEIVEGIFRLTSTLGIRAFPVERHAAVREVQELASSLGPVRIKVKRLNGRAVDVHPEYEDCAGLARKLGLPLRQVYDLVKAEAAAKLLSD
jgi:uncharacterized protein (TIGR00299 family) protein